MQWWGKIYCFQLLFYSHLFKERKIVLWLFPCVHMLINTGIIFPSELAGINSIEPCSHTQLVICKSQKYTTSRFYWIHLLMILLWFWTINRGITRIIRFLICDPSISEEYLKGKSHETLYKYRINLVTPQS